MGLFPGAGGEFIGLGQGGIDMNRAEDLVHAETLPHGADVFRDQFAGMLADYGRAEDFIPPGCGQHLDHAPRLALGNGPVQFVQAVMRDLVADALAPRVLFVQPDPRHLRVGKGGPGDHGVIGLEALEAAKQRVDRGIPGLVRGRVGKLVRPRDIATGIDIRYRGLQLFIHANGAVGVQFNAQFFQAKARAVGCPAHGA